MIFVIIGPIVEKERRNVVRREMILNKLDAVNITVSRLF